MEFYFKKKVKNNIYKLMAINPAYSLKVMKAVMKKRKRKNQIYCVGLPKSGTHSLAHLFGGIYRSRHEPLTGPTVKFCMSVANGNGTEAHVLNLLMMRDNFLNLEVEASHYLYILVPYLVDLFPDSKFVLTVREPRSWLNSEINMNLRTAGDGLWDEYQKFKYGEYSYSYESEYLKNNLYLYPISNYLEYYKKHIKTVMDHVPNNRLLIVDTFSISSELDKIASFAKISTDSLNLKKQHISKGKKRIHIENIIDQDVLNQKIKVHCDSFINEYVPFLRGKMR